MKQLSTYRKLRIAIGIALYACVFGVSFYLSDCSWVILVIFVLALLFSSNIQRIIGFRDKYMNWTIF
jgi:hypothetical protein